MAARVTVHHRGDTATVLPAAANSETPVEPDGGEVWGRDNDLTGPISCVERDTVATVSPEVGEHDG
jgi:hypothetical protein